MPFWGAQCPPAAVLCASNVDPLIHDMHAHVVEATYVDDEALNVCASSPKALQTNVQRQPELVQV